MKPIRRHKLTDSTRTGAGRTALAVLRTLSARPGNGRADAGPTAVVPSSYGQTGPVAPAVADDLSALSRWRGTIDARAMRVRFSDAALYAQQAPQEGEAAQLFSLLEQMRTEILGARLYPGIRRNLESLGLEQWLRARPEANTRGTGWVETFALLARAALGAPLPVEASSVLAQRWRHWMSAREITEIQSLNRLLDDQAGFGRQSLHVIDAVLGPQTELMRFDGAVERSEPVDQLESGALSVQRDPEQDGRPMKGPVAEAHAAQEAPPARRAKALSLDAPYRVYTRRYDEITTPAELCDAATLARRRHELDTLVERHLGSALRWAHRLQRQLMTQQKRYWEFDQEEGLLDATRLTRIVTRPLESLVFKREREAPFPSTIVSMLVDNSGSMRGDSITTAALCVELLGRVLERCSIRTEVLGYTTRAWRGGRAYERWCQEGRPPAPGRLAELRHIVYKDAGQPWRRARTGLGAMLDEGLLKDNVDGEALLWAQQRLQRRPEARRILIVICDGEPMEEATRQANDPEYLERHLRTVIRDIERNSGTQLVAIGIDHNVQRLYARAAKVRRVEDLGEAIFRQLLALLGA